MMIIRIMALIVFLAPLLQQDCLAEYSNPSTGDDTNVAYWLDLGGLYAAYGNFSAAVKAYKKALDLDPDDSAAYFDLSLALCEILLWPGLEIGKGRQSFRGTSNISSCGRFK